MRWPGQFIAILITLIASSLLAQPLIPPPPGSLAGTKYCRDPHLCSAYRDIFFGTATTGYVFGKDLFRTTDGGQTWVPLTGQAAGRPIRGARLFFVDNSVFFIYADEFLWTTNGGQSFSTGALHLPSVLEPGTTATVLEQFFFLDATRGWAVSDTGLVGTTDGGASWGFMRRVPSVLGPVRAIWMFDQQRGILAGDRQVAYTEDGWGSWRLAANVPHMRDVKCAKDRFCMGRGIPDEIAYVSTDAGQTWQQTQTGIDPERDWIVDFKVFAASNVVLVGTHTPEEPIVFKNVDPRTPVPVVPTPRPPRGLMIRWNGTSWQRTDYPEFETLWTVHFVDDNEVWGSADNNGIIHSTDGGKTWTFVPDYYRQIAALTPSRTPFVFPTPAPTL